jgi:hypothetical protein
MSRLWRRERRSKTGDGRNNGRFFAVRSALSAPNRLLSIASTEGTDAPSDPGEIARPPRPGGEKVKQEIRPKSAEKPKASDLGRWGIRALFNIGANP